MTGHDTGSAGASRRTFLAGAASLAAGLVIGLRLAPGRAAEAALAAETTAPLPFNAFVEIAPDNSVTVLIKHLEMGQGVYTGLATVLAEELDADFDQIRVRTAPADATRYANLAFGTVQGTGGSTSLANSYMQLREAGAMARAMLVAAAAERFGVPAAEIEVSEGLCTHKSGKRSSFGELAAAAARMAPPASVVLKDPKDFKLIGQSPHRLDSRMKTDGSAVFAIDVVRAGMLTAVIARPPRFGGKVKSVAADAARAVPGVVDVVEIPQGVAVVATGFHAAVKGRAALDLAFDDTLAEKRGTAELLAEYRALLDRPGTAVLSAGDAAAAALYADEKRVVAADFSFPYLAHAPMEPLTCVVELKPDRCDVWAGSQLQTVDQLGAAAAAGLTPDKVFIHTVLAGGSFGRRANPPADYITEGVAVARAIGGRAPVKLIWTREDDIKGGRYRPMVLHRVRAALDARGAIAAWSHRIVGQPIILGTPFGAAIANGVDPPLVEGADELPYAIPHRSLDIHVTEVGVPVLWWRSVGHTHTAYVVESVMDMLAAKAGRDPLEFRLAHMEGHPRHAAVLRLAAERAGWGSPLPPGRGRGLAVHESFSSYVAEVAEVTLGEGGAFKVDRVTCAVDCGIAVNPDIVRAQMEGGIGFGLGAALRGRVTLTEGRVDQSNFHDYVPLRIDEMPAVEVHIMPSPMAPTGVGEPGVPPIAPAVANALHAAGGPRVLDLPFEAA